MNNKINVTICSRPYTLIPGDEHTQVEQIAAKVDQAMNAVLQRNHVSALDAAVLTAVNAVDAAEEADKTAETLRSQLQDCMEENKKLRQELADTRRELTRLKNGKKK
jgi:cell division protein ZapA